jgi:hypothetical protein
MTPTYTHDVGCPRYEGQKQEGEEPAVYHGPLESFWPPEGWVQKSKYDRLREQLDAAKSYIDRTLLANMPERLAAAESELEAARKRTIEAEKDAERYRWLRDNNSPDVSVVFKLGDDRWDWGIAKHPHAFDTAIDLARSLPLTGSAADIHNPT